MTKKISLVAPNKVKKLPSDITVGFVWHAPDLSDILNALPSFRGQDHIAAVLTEPHSSEIITMW